MFVFTIIFLIFFLMPYKTVCVDGEEICFNNKVTGIWIVDYDYFLAENISPSHFQQLIENPNFKCTFDYDEDPSNKVLKITNKETGEEEEQITFERMDFEDNLYYHMFVPF